MVDLAGQVCLALVTRLGGQCDSNVSLLYLEKMFGVLLAYQVHWRSCLDCVK